MGKRFLLILWFLSLAPAAAVPARAACYGLAVGIDHYDTPGNDLSYCCADAIGVRNALLSHGGGWTESGFAILTNAAANRSAIRNAFSNLAAKAVSGDTVVYYQSSHGGNATDDPTSVYLLVYDTKYTDVQLAEDLSLFRSGVKVIVAVDACHSGGLFTDDVSSQSRSAVSLKSPSAVSAKSRPAAWNLAASVTARMEASRAATAAKNSRSAASSIAPEEIGWLTACTYYQLSYETDAIGHGFFTYYLLAAFDSGDADGDGKLDFREMFDFAVCRVPFYGQLPQSANPDRLAAAVAAATGVAPLPAGDAWDYADNHPAFGPTPISISGDGQTHGPHTLRAVVDESDVFAFSASALRPVTFSSTGGTALSANLYDARFRPIRRATGTTGTGDFRLVFKPAEDGIFYLQVCSSAANDAYTLHYRKSPDASDTFPTLHPPCTNAIGYLAQGKTAEYRVVIPEGCTLFSLRLSGTSGDADLYLGQGFIPDAQLGEYTKCSQNTTCSEVITCSYPDPGEWFVSVHAYRAAFGLQLAATATPRSPFETVPAILSDLDPGTGTATAIVLYPDHAPTPATLPVYSTTNLAASGWTFKTNAPLSGSLLVFPLPDAPAEYLAIGQPPDADADP
jgi:hypothetical protein